MGENMKRACLRLIGAFLMAAAFLPATVSGAGHVLKMATTTSTENSGLLDVLLPEFTKDTGIEVKVFPKGTGAAIRDGMDGNVDIILVHDLAREKAFVEDGYGAYRLAVMHNDFVVLGPENDPAGIKGMAVDSAFKKIAVSEALFVSRGDDSGTHSKEQAIWTASKTPLDRKETQLIKNGKAATLTYDYPAGMGGRYLSIGQGMGKVLTFAEEKQAYTLSDRGTYLKYKFGREQGLDLEILCEGDEILFNPYGVIPVNPEKYPGANFKDAETFAKWLVSEKGQGLIAAYKIHGQQAFFPDAH
jgi:tungstate transport system substrate-binding protein